MITVKGLSESNKRDPISDPIRCLWMLASGESLDDASYANLKNSIGVLVLKYNMDKMNVCLTLPNGCAVEGQFESFSGGVNQYCGLSNIKNRLYSDPDFVCGIIEDEDDASQAEAHSINFDMDCSGDDGMRQITFVKSVLNIKSILNGCARIEKDEELGGYDIKYVGSSGLLTCISDVSEMGYQEGFMIMDRDPSLEPALNISQKSLDRIKAEIKVKLGDSMANAFMLDMSI